ncbi:MAG: 2Fe-2S iron-sulfur cluster-binding protein [Gemmatimonadota bacterium]|nr:2Fe-2S iron-sulfur cluster-binding protein [Gemmatimonadota bacterium]
MIEKVGLVLRVNELGRELEVEPRRILADVLRDEFQLRSVHLGCEQGACGGCTVLVDGEPAASCMLLAVQVEGRDVRTLEGLTGTSRMRLLQSAFHEHYALQCGYCIPGVLVNLYSFLEEGEPVAESEVRSRLSGNLCRCTGYQNMVAAAVAVSEGRSEPDRGLEELHGVGPELAERLRAKGFPTRGSVALASASSLVAIPGIGVRTAERLIAAATSFESTRKAGKGRAHPLRGRPPRPLPPRLLHEGGYQP